MGKYVVARADDVKDGERMLVEVNGRSVGIFNLGGPLKIPHLMPRGPTFYVAYQWTRNRTAETESGLVPTDAERTGDLSDLVQQLQINVGSR